MVRTKSEQAADVAHAPAVTPTRMASQAGTASDADEQVLEIIQRTWADILHVETVAPDDDFFEIGGNSLIVAFAVARLGERLGLELPLRSLFEAPTPIEMAELIGELRAERAAETGEGTTPFFPRWVVPLQRAGAGRPVFVFPGGMGSKWMLIKDAQVAALVGRDHPFYGFQRDRPHISRTRADWIPAMAAGYAEQIRLIQGRGPYLLYALCNGGPLAWETTRQLTNGGETADILFYEVPLAADYATSLGSAVTPIDVDPGRMPPYLPEPLPVDLTLLMTEAWQAKDRSAGWRQVARGQIETVVMPGDTPGAHNLYADREEMIAEHLRDWIARSEARL
ncbi:MAG: phosphopantetheine-binding protein [Thermomicrobiales bacterium]